MFLGVYWHNRIIDS